MVAVILPCFDTHFPACIGVLVLPACLTVYGRRSLARVSRSLRMSELQALESSLLATMVDSITELSVCL